MRYQGDLCIISFYLQNDLHKITPISYNLRMQTLLFAYRSINTYLFKFLFMTNNMNAFSETCNSKHKMSVQTTKKSFVIFLLLLCFIVFLHP